MKKKKAKAKEKRRGSSVQSLMGIQRFTQYGLLTDNGELLFYAISPTNISVLSHANIEQKIHHLMLVLSSVPELEIICTDSSECFDANKIYLRKRLESESNDKIRDVITKDINHLDAVQIEMATARQFIFAVRAKETKDKQVFTIANDIEKTIADQGFEVRRMNKADIKRFLALYFDASMNGDQIADVDGASFLLNDDIDI